MTKPTAFVAGATGYTGREVVRLLAQSGVDTIAHIRPNSSRLDEYTPRFESYGAQVDTTPWDENEMCECMSELQPDIVFCLIGTTRARKQAADNPNNNTYHAVDFKLTELLVHACQQAEIQPRFVYISAIGVGPNATTSYMKARWMAERSVVESQLPYTVVRPAFISGPGRGESRPGERVAAAVGDAVLEALGALGAKKLRDRYASMTNTELAEHLVALALSPDAANTVVDAYDLRHRD
ncbi:NAD(P)H-binding protein [Persicimonas caeni]|uniref:NAD(P)H-binding protein n=1 Tax=Persicimonas caeni TaxID=2292766 RepID=UPI001C9A9534|nr:NAD(P)H-binding protein [Persicimonas caeni]